MFVFKVALLVALAFTFCLGDEGPAPPSIGADIPLVYFGPAPSSVQRELVGPFQLLKSGTVDFEKNTITLPLYEGTVGASRRPNFFILTDTNDKGNADALGLNYSPKLTYANFGKAVRKARYNGQGKVEFENGDVDFSPVRNLVKGSSSPFPPSVATPGSVGDRNYSPLFLLENGGNFIYNGPTISQGLSADQLNEFCDGISADREEYARRFIHDKVRSICPRDGTVELALTNGFSFAKPVLYLSTDSNNPTGATFEESTYSTALQDVTVGRDDSAFSAVERLFAVINGYTNRDIPAGGNETVHPSRQGFNSALLGEGGPLNVLGGIPTVATDYSPLWDVNLSEFTPRSVQAGFRVRLLEEFQILGLVEKGVLTGPGGAPFGSSGIIVNCPIVHRFL